jgi:hypothetical protein
MELTRDEAHKMLDRAGKGVKANQLRTLFFELLQPWKRIKNLTMNQVQDLLRLISMSPVSWTTLNQFEYARTI